MKFFGVLHSFTLVIGVVLISSCGSSSSEEIVHRLQTYKIDANSVSVSGFSSGGAMAMQFHIAFSKDIHGSGVFSGLPYACGAYFNETECKTCVCHTAPTDALENIARSEFTLGNIDDPTNLVGKNVYVFFGKNDSGLNPALGPKIADVYQRFGVNLKTEFTIEAEHGYPTDFYGLPCGQPSASTQLINNCSYQGAFEMLSHLYDNNLTKPSANHQYQGDLFKFDQSEFVEEGEAIDSSLDSTGFIFVPLDCATKVCRLHLALHGCTQSRTAIGSIFVTQTGYLPVADINDIILVFPQAKPNPDLGNLNGCWDWWNYLGTGNHVNKLGAQMKVLHRIVERITRKNEGRK